MRSRTLSRPRHTHLWHLLVLLSALVAGLTTLFGAVTASAADTVVGKDAFGRTSSSGWGASSVGGSWTVAGGTGSSTTSGAAVVSGVKGGYSAAAVLTSVSAQDVTVLSTFVAPAATEFYYGPAARVGADGSAYRSRARIDSAHQLHVELVRVNQKSETWLAQKTVGTTIPAGSKVTVELSVSGTNPVSLQARAYLSSASTPGWQLDYRDTSSAQVVAAGAVGIRAHNTAGQPTTDVTTVAFSATATSTASAPASTTTPAPTATPTATPTEAPTSSDEPTKSSGYGSVPVGQTAYPVPSGAVFVATNGSDSAAGTLGAPVRTVTKALTKVKGGGTIVIRGGTYHEYFLVPPGKNVFIQSYPKEAVWFDGSEKVSGFSAAGTRYATSWTTQLDSSPTYVKGNPDYTAVGWQFVNPAHPMAAHPDQVWIDGAEQEQVGSLSQVTAGTFFADYSAKKLYLGSNPAGKTVEASTLPQAVSLRAPGTVLRGLGFRRYADSVWMQGVITTYFKNQTIENVVVADSATGGIGIYETGSTLNGVTITGSGQLAFQSGHADNLTLNNLSLVNNNDQHFNPAPSAGGIKLHNTRTMSLTNSEIRNTDGNQFWSDTSCNDLTLAHNSITNGTRYGIVLEISSHATVVDNVVADNDWDGIAVIDTDQAKVWNNTVVDNGHAAISVTQDSRRIENLSVYGHDERRSQPDLSMPWVSRGTSIGNNLMSPRSSSNAVLQAESWDKAFNGSDMLTSSGGNVFAQPSSTSPSVVVRWGKKGTYATQYKTFEAYVAATGYDKTSAKLIQNPVTSAYVPTSEAAALGSRVAQNIPSDVAAKAGKSATSKHVGAWH